MGEWGGVYRITCTATGKSYIGGSMMTRDRWRNHRCLLNNWKHHNKELQTDWLIFGEGAFEFVVIERHWEPCRVDPGTPMVRWEARRKKAKRKILEREQTWISVYSKSSGCYNR